MKQIFYSVAQIVDGTGLDVPRSPADDSQLQSVLEIVFIFAGAIAVIVILIAGFSYVISVGDSQKAAKAKDAILYGVIGLVIIVLANIIVPFVLGRIFS